MDFIIDNFIHNYLSEDGLCRLDEQDDREPFPPATDRTVKNQNGIMFFAETLMYFKWCNISVLAFKQTVRRSLNKLFIEGTGCTDRRQYDKSLVDSHDNMLGIVVLCQMLGLNTFIERINFWGWVNGWCYNNLDPSRFDIRGLRQGSDVAIYQLANGDRPHLINLIWLWGAFFAGNDIRLLVLRLESVKMSNEAYKNASLTVLLGNLAFILRGGRKKLKLALEDYFKDPNHPIRQCIGYWGNKNQPIKNQNAVF